MSDTIDTPDLTLHAVDGLPEPSPGGAPPDDEADVSAESVTSSEPACEDHAAPPAPSGPGPESIVEAVLFASDAPLKAAKIAEIAELPGVKAVKLSITALNERYEQQGAAFRIEQIAEGFQMLTLPEYNRWLTKLLRVRQETRLSQAALETLAIVAYKQPILRADVEAIRGVACGEMLNRLRELNLIKIVGRAEDVGRPILYGSTRSFLEVFGLGSLDDLPEIEALKPPE